jgi:hypothetical protein
MDDLLRRASPALHVTSLGTVGLCIGLWIRAKTVSQEERGNAERRALFVGLWPPTLWLIADSLERAAARPERWPRFSGAAARRTGR